jgi:lysophospholipase L1-like esterase
MKNISVIIIFSLSASVLSCSFGVDVYVVKNGNPHLNYYGCIKGETITLSGNQSNYLYKNNFFDLNLYGIISQGGMTIQYLEGIDYIIDNNSIRRTDNSRIPDFSRHQVIYNSEGKFKFTSEPRNPELTIPYHVYADYRFPHEANIAIKPVKLMSDSLQRKLSYGEDIVIVTIGTSISAGAHTYQYYYNESDQQTYFYLVAKAINKIYDINCRVINESTDGGGVNQIQNMDVLLSSNPDIVFIELGMNDHSGENPNIEYFYNSITRAVEYLLVNDVDVVLVGFFQQIETWELEYPQHTIAFNDVLSEIASTHNIFFADIYSFFELIDKNKLYKDYMGDFMHHPTSFGHQLYYLNIIPFFLDRETEEADLFEYIYGVSE